MMCTQCLMDSVRLKTMYCAARLWVCVGCCITNHGNVFGHYDLWSLCKKHGMKPIFANEGYVAPGSGLVKEKIEGEKPR